MVATPLIYECGFYFTLALLVMCCWCALFRVNPLSDTAEDAHVAVSNVWVEQSHRKSGILTRLLDAVRYECNPSCTAWDLFMFGAYHTCKVAGVQWAIIVTGSRKRGLDIANKIHFEIWT